MASRSSQNNRGSRPLDDATKKQMEENLNGANPVLYISALPGFHQPFKSTENWNKSKKCISNLWRDMGEVKDVSFQRLRNGRIACFIQFENDTLDEDVREELREEGRFQIQGKLFVRKDWDYSRGEPKRYWNYNVSVSRYQFLNAKDRKDRRRKNSPRKPKFKFTGKRERIQEGVAASATEDPNVPQEPVTDDDSGNLSD